MCEGKTKYTEEHEAISAAKLVSRSAGTWLVAYYCKFCHRWHIGHPTARVRQSIMAKAANRRKGLIKREDN